MTLHHSTEGGTEVSVPPPFVEKLDKRGGRRGIHKNDWSEQEIAALKLGWDQGLTGSQIGKLLGKTRCAVLGKVRRLGLQERGSGHNNSKEPKVRAPRITRERKPPGNNVYAIKKKTKPVAPTFYAEPVPLTDKPPIPLMELRRNSCRAVVGRGADGLALYCGDNIFMGKPFCQGHCAMYYEHRAA